MIEATIVEVTLGKGYEQGIDWSRLIGPGKFALALNTLRATNSANNLTYKGTTVETGIRLLKPSVTPGTFQPAPVGAQQSNRPAEGWENLVYFNVKADVTAGNLNANPVIAFTTTPQTVSVGMVLAVTPQIGETDSIISQRQANHHQRRRFRQGSQPQPHRR